MLAAGLAGVKGKYKLDDPVERNAYEMTKEDREKLGIRQLPSDLNEAIKEAEKSDLLRVCLGDHVFTKLLENKRLEWHAYRSHVSQFELENYLPIL